MPSDSDSTPRGVSIWQNLDSAPLLMSYIAEVGPRLQMSDSKHEPSLGSSSSVTHVWEGVLVTLLMLLTMRVSVPVPSSSVTHVWEGALVSLLMLSTMRVSIPLPWSWVFPHCTQRFGPVTMQAPLLVAGKVVVGARELRAKQTPPNFQESCAGAAELVN